MPEYLMTFGQLTEGLGDVQAFGDELIQETVATVKGAIPGTEIDDVFGGELFREADGEARLGALACVRTLGTA